jgi:hypothetical protein
MEEWFNVAIRGDLKDLGDREEAKPGESGLLAPIPTRLSVVD